MGDLRARRSSETIAPFRVSKRLRCLLLALVVAAVGCSARQDAGSSAAGAAVLDGSVSGFESFSGMKLPAAATAVDIMVSADDGGHATYLVGFDLPTAQVDQFCRDGQMGRPLRVITIPQTTRVTFHYQGDSSSGVRIGEASLPSNVNIQREVFVTGAHSPISHVQVHSYSFGR